MSILGISITKHNRELTMEDVTELNGINIGVKCYSDRYLLYYLPNPSPLKDDRKTLLHLKGLLTRVSSPFKCNNVFLSSFNGEGFGK